MKPWTTPQEIKDKVRKEWDRGTLARAWWLGSGVEIPFRLPLRGPTSSEWSDRFDQARAWIAALDGLPLEWREFTHPRLGRNQVPTAVLWPDLEGLLAFVGKRKESDRYRTLAGRLASRFPPLADWLADHPLEVLEVGDDWEPVIAFLDWRTVHPRPGIYLRQVDLPGVHTKFLEARRGLLATLLDLVLPSEQVGTQTGAARFAERYGFLSKPRMVRFRHLDPRHPGPRDQSWRLEDWAAWADPPRTWFITENEVNFLAFPDRIDTAVVFGAGYGFEGWPTVVWLAGAEVHYWGDLDTHGFAILDQLRAALPRASSFLMDERTLLAHRMLWGHEPEPADRELSRLTEDERRVYEGLVHHRWGPNFRLEQERIGYRWVEAELKKIL